MEEIKKCETCQHFNSEMGWEGKDDGICKRLSNSQLLPTDVWFKQFILFHGDNNPMSVHVGKDFGCVLHKESKNA